MLRTKLAALALAVATLASSGCGSSSKTTSTTTAATNSASTTTAAPAAATVPTVTIASGKPLTRTAWIAQANAICARRNVKLMTISIVSTREFVRLMPEVAIYDSTEAAELSKLVPPASISHDWAQLLGEFQLYGEDLSKVAQDAQAGKFAAMTPIFKAAENLHMHLQTVAKHHGLEKCSEAR